MTYSYATRAWALLHMEKNFFGLQTIATCADVKPKTLQSWFRQDTNRAPDTLKMPREYERAMGILLLDNFPEAIEKIAKQLNTNTRAVLQWRVENRYRPYSSELRRRTHEGTKILEKFVLSGIFNHGKEKYLDNKMLWPDPMLIFRETWLALDAVLLEKLHRLFWWRYCSETNSPYLLAFQTRPTRMVGPHSTRYAEIETEGPWIHDDYYFEQSRRTGHILGCYNHEAVAMAEITDELLCTNNNEGKLIELPIGEVDPGLKNVDNLKEKPHKKIAF